MLCDKTFINILSALMSTLLQKQKFKFQFYFVSLVVSGETKAGTEESNTGSIVLVVLGLGALVCIVIGYLKCKKNKSTYQPTAQIDREMVEIGKKDVENQNATKEAITEATPLTENGKCVDDIKYENETETPKKVNSDKETTQDEDKEVTDEDDLKYMDEQEGSNSSNDTNKRN